MWIGESKFTRNRISLAITSLMVLLVCSTNTLAQVQALDQSQAELERLKKILEGKPIPYEDKFLNTINSDASNLQSNIDPEAQGFRTYLFETRLGSTSSKNTGAETYREGHLGLRSEYRFETLNYGEFSIQADLRSRNGANDTSLNETGLKDKRSNSRITLRNYAFPLLTDVYADTAIGDINSETTDALVRNYRFSLGNSTVKGVSTHVYSNRFDLRAGTGNLGQLEGDPYPIFEKTRGQMTWLGYSYKFATPMFMGMQVKRARDVLVQNNTETLGSSLGNVFTLAASLGYGHALIKDGDIKARLTFLNSRTSSKSEDANHSANGFFLEGGYQLGNYRTELGAYKTDPHLNMGDYTLEVANTRGVYWRIDHGGRRFSWGMGLDFEQQNSGLQESQLTYKRSSLNINAQQVIDRDSSIVLNANVSRLRNAVENKILNKSDKSGSNSYYANISYQTRLGDLGRSTFTLSMRRNQAIVSNDIAATGEDIAWDHDWVTGKYETMRPELRTLLGYARDRSSSETQTYPTAGLVLRFWPDADWNIGGSLNYSSRTGNLSTSRGLSGNLSTERIFANGWRLGTAVNLNQAVVNTNLLTTYAPIVSRSDNKSIYVFLRYEGNDGQTQGVLGYRYANSAGSGGINGIVFFDHNRDNTQQAHELGVPNIEVVLDGRYRVTTNKEGRFEFPFVTTGSHQIGMQLDSVPLPWGTQMIGMPVDVPLRATATVALPIVRVAD